MTSPLRQQYLEDMQLHGLSRGTKEISVSAVKQLAEYFHKSPDQVTEEELRVYLLYLKNVKKVSASTFTIALAGSISSLNTPCIGNGSRWTWYKSFRRKTAGGVNRR